MKKFYREFTCVACGVKAIDRGARQNARFCSSKCQKRAYRKGIKPENLSLCKNNEGVICTSHNCDGCGWSPDVEKSRKEALYEQL